MDGRIFGIETEYGCLIPDSDFPLTSDQLSQKIKDTIFSNTKYGVLDMHYRGRDEPPGNGGFLFNGGRVYMDLGHVEYATPECNGLFDLVAADQAGDLLVQMALEKVDPTGEISLIKNNVDHYTGATFGCHENYLVKRGVPFSQVILPAMLPFFVTRQIFAGAGRVGTYTDSLERNEIKIEDVPYQISQRADHIVTEVYQWIQFSRAIINSRDEPLADWTQFRRLHLLIGDSNMSEYATALKIGTTGAVIQLLEEGIIPEISIADAVVATRGVSRDTNYRWEIQLDNGSYSSALDIQRHYLDLTERYLKGKDQELDWVLGEWRFVLDGLTYDPNSLVDRIDWIAKKKLLERFMEAENLEWNDPWLKSLDLEYHNLNRSRGLYFDLIEHGRMTKIVDEAKILCSIQVPPVNTRAAARSRIMHGLNYQESRYAIDWDNIYVEQDRHVKLDDPFQTYSQVADDFVAECLRGCIPDSTEKQRKNLLESKTDGLDQKKIEEEHKWLKEESELIEKRVKVEEEISTLRKELCYHSQDFDTDQLSVIEKKYQQQFEEINWLLEHLKRKKSEELFLRDEN